jgi:hypothetical protein
MIKLFAKRQEQRPCSDRAASDLFGFCHDPSTILSTIMRRVILAGSIVLIISPLWASEPEPPKQSFKDTIQCAEYLPRGKDSPLLPASMTREALIQKLHPTPLLDSDEEFERICGILARELPSQVGNTAVFLVYQRYTKNRFGGYHSSDLLVQIGILAHADKPRWVATTSSPIHLKEASIRALDVAPYRVTPELTAFGMRWDRHFMYAGGGGVNQYLELFIVDGDVVTPILSTLMRSGSLLAGAWHKDGTRDHKEHGADIRTTISILKTMTLGHFDLLKKQGKRRAILKWDGNRYVLDGKEPVQNVNDED